MSNAVASDALGLACVDLGSELFEVVQRMDPVRWRDEVRPAMARKLELLAERTRQIRARYERHPEREDAAAEVVDDGVDVGLGAVEQPDHGGIDVPGFLGPRCPQADLGLARMNTLARSPPSP